MASSARLPGGDEDGCRRRSYLWWAAGLLLLPLFLAGCRGRMSRKPPLELIPNMDHQEKYLPQAASSYYASGGAMQAPPPGTVARGSLKEDEPFFTGKSFWSGYVKENPLGRDPAVERRGRERFRIFCTPCHGVHADGNGILLTRGHVKSANLLEEKTAALADGRLYEVISDGMGMMPPYRYQIPPQDRWAIVAYLRVLQSQNPPARVRAGRLRPARILAESADAPDRKRP
ncbi:MAG: c-type cytochrome [Acidobacteriota bacterium]